jgi:hypothetical protein
MRNEDGTMKSRTFVLTAAAVGLLFVAADGPARGQEKSDYAALERLIHKMMAGQMPPAFEQAEHWGQTIPIPDKLLLPRLRTVVEVNGREELPHGLWRKLRGRIEDPQRDLVIRVRSFEGKGNLTYRIALDADVVLRGEGEVQHWQKGLALVGLLVDADIVVRLSMECAVKARPDPKKPLALVRLETKVDGLKMDLTEFTLKRVSLRRLGPILEGEKAEAAGGLVRGLVEKSLVSMAPQMQEQINQALARGAAREDGGIPTADLLKALPPAPKK